MPTWDAVARLALALPETTEERRGDGARHWKVNGKLFVWERPLRPADERALGTEAPTGAILAARVPDEGVKTALVTDDPTVYFTIPHFDGYPAVLVRLERIRQGELAELVEEAWLARAPKRVAAAYLAGR